MQKLTYRLRYWKRKLWHLFGRCPKCNGAVNWTTKGRPICPDCGH